MGPYPLDPPVYYQRWKKLTGYITPGLVRRILPNNGKVSHLPDKSTENSNIKDKRLGKAIEREEGMEFTQFDLRKSFPSGASGDEITRYSLDKSWLVRHLLKEAYNNSNYKEKKILLFFKINLFLNRLQDFTWRNAIIFCMFINGTKLFWL